MNDDSDLQIAGDLFEVEHLLQPPCEHPGTVAEFAGLARAVADDSSAWKHLVRYDAASRWYHRLRTGPGYEVWLLSWVPGQGSGPHGHGPSAGILTVLAGELTEHTGSTGSTESTGITADGTAEWTGGTAGARRGGRTWAQRAPGRRLRPGTQRVYPPGYAHEIVNASLEPAVSLHVYYPGLTEMPMRHVPAATHSNGVASTVGEGAGAAAGGEPWPAARRGVEGVGPGRTVVPG